MSKDQTKERNVDTKVRVKGVGSKGTGSESMKQQNKMEKDAGNGQAADRDAKGGSKKGR